MKAALWLFAVMMMLGGSVVAGVTERAVMHLQERHDDLRQRIAAEQQHKRRLMAKWSRLNSPYHLKQLQASYAQGDAP